jgi:hypothetical protein
MQCESKRTTSFRRRLLRAAALAQMPAAERGHKRLGRAAAGRHLSQLAAVLGLCALALLEACPGGVSQARATLATIGLAYAVQVRMRPCAHVPPRCVVKLQRLPRHNSLAWPRRPAERIGAPLVLDVIQRPSGAGVRARARAQATKLIMDHMAKEPFELLGWPLALVALNIAGRRAALPWLDGYAWGLAATMLAGYLHYITSAIGDICAFLRIACLTIKQAPS